jgi:hypothetical protein
MGNNGFKRLGIGLSICIVAMFFSSIVGAPVTSFSAPVDVDITEINSNVQPSPMANPGPEKPLVWADDGDFIISYDDEPELYNATAPDIAAAPVGSPFEGSLHAVWSEMNKTPADPYFEIHYSMSDDDRGLEWSNDEAAEGDKIISDTEIGKGMIAGDALWPAIAIDPQGFIHVVWAQAYPDGTYEVHYSRSDDNGKTWTGFDGPGDTLVSWRAGNGDAPWINPPRIAISMNPIILHVAWSEVFGGERMEVMYSRSFDQGNSWTGAMSGDVMISDMNTIDDAYEADIGVSRVDGQSVHVVWTQNEPATGTSEVFYVKSWDFGDNWEVERPISFVDNDFHYAYRARLASEDDYVHVVWDQDGPFGFEVYYSGSFDDGQSFTGEGEDTMISFPDGNGVWYPVVGTSDFGQNVVVVWSEVDDKSPMGSMEIHISETSDPMDPASWSGINDDIVVSWPDPGVFTMAHSAAVVIGASGRPQIVWQEENIISSSKATRNDEIHYIPATTFNAPVQLGWNFISVPLIQTDTNILSVLSDSWGDGSTNWDLVYAYVYTGSVGEWKSYAKFKPASLNTLTSIDNTMGFWIRITSLGDGNLTFHGDYDVLTAIPLKAGWNLVGYPGQDDRSVTNAFSGVPAFQAANGYSAAATYKITTLPGTYMMTPGEAYWIQVSSDTTWTINW